MGMMKTLMADSKHSSEILRAHCRQNHSIDTIFYQISMKFFNVMNRNYVSQLNDAVLQVKRPKAGASSQYRPKRLLNLLLVLSNGVFCRNCIVLYRSGFCIKMSIITYMLFYCSKKIILCLYLLSYAQQSSIFF